MGWFTEDSKPDYHSEGQKDAAEGTYESPHSEMDFARESFMDTVMGTHNVDDMVADNEAYHKGADNHYHTTH